MDNNKMAADKMDLQAASPDMLHGHYSILRISTKKCIVFLGCKRLIPVKLTEKLITIFKLKEV